jgi:hypothetical protein
VQRWKPDVGEFCRGWADSIGVGNLEFDAGLRRTALGGPLGGTEARLGRLR